ncbi:sialate O-acetylesterase [Massilia sp. SYSU DXS3249]
MKFMKRTGFKAYALVLSICALLAACGGGGGGSDAATAVTPLPPPVVARPVVADLKILVLGQSISSNCNQRLYGPVDNVLQVGFDGSIKPARDPFEWADCAQGSMWMPLGKKLIDSGVALKVTFMPIGVAGSRTRDWQKGGSAFDKLNSALALIKRQGLSFDYAFWHQGSADIGLDKDEYLGQLSSVIEYVNANAKIDRWLIALHSRCAGRYDPNIEMVQRAFGNAPASRRYPGPNTNLLGNEYRLPDACHLNERGQEEMASLWLDAVRNSLD